VRHGTPAFATKLSGAALIAGLLISGVATAAPVGASEGMKVELHKLRICESGDNYRENTGNGYYGAYQFAPTTWHALGFAGRPDRAKRAAQNRAARKMHSQDGWHAWPSCSQTEHLR
jgi:Transglycosylase-like domain